MAVNRRRFLQTVGASGVITIAGCTSNGSNGGGSGNGSNGGGSGNGSNGGGSGNGSNGGSSRDVTIGTLTPLSGPFSRDGTLVKKGVDFAVKEINDNGGIDALNGANLKVEAKDTGDSTSSATSAAQSLYSDSNPSATIGSWLSSQTLATTSVSERSQVPQLTLSYSDKIINRGYKYTFQTGPTSSGFGKKSLNRVLSLAKAQGKEIKKVALVGDNTAAITFTFDPIKKKFIPQKKGIEVVVDKQWSPTLSDATPIVRDLKNKKPDVMFFGATAFPDSLAILRKMNELGVSLPTIGIGAWLTLPAYVNNIGAKLTEGIMAVTSANPVKGQVDLVKSFTSFADEPFMIQDSLIGYANTHLIAAAMEKSKSSDPTTIKDTLHNNTFTSGPGVKSLPVEKVKYEKNGHLHNAQVILSQWQKKGDASYIKTPAAPFTAFPKKYRVRKVNWMPAKYS